MTVCPSCHRVVTEEDAAFCAGCGARLTVDAPPVTVPVVDPVPSVAPPVTAPPVDAAHEVVQPAAVTPSTASRRRTNANRQAAFVALVGAALAIVGAFQVWVRIRIAGLAPPGSAQSGWAGGDGRTIVVAAGVAAVAALASLLGRRETWVKIVLLITGATTTIIAIVNMVDAGSKAHDIEVQFGIPGSAVDAQVGIGLYLVVAGGLALVAAGLRTRSGDVDDQVK